MSVAVVSGSSLLVNGVSCWSAERVLGKCVRCSHLLSCKRAEAKIGRLEMKKMRLEKMKLQISQLSSEIERLESEIAAGVDGTEKSSECG